MKRRKRDADGKQAVKHRSWILEIEAVKQSSSVYIEKMRLYVTAEYQEILHMMCSSRKTMSLKVDKQGDRP